MQLQKDTVSTKLLLSRKWSTIFSNADDESPNSRTEKKPLELEETGKLLANVKRV